MQIISSKHKYMQCHMKTAHVKFHIIVSLTTADAKVQLMQSMHHVGRIYSCAFFVPRNEQQDYVYFEPGERYIIVMIFKRSLLQINV